jgi:multiple sugar transport system permease protein
MNKTVSLIGRYALLSIVALIFLFPIVFMLVSSLKPDIQLLRDSSSLLAFVPYGDLSFDNYIEAFRRVPIARFILNSVFITGTTTLLSLFVNSMAGFAIAVPRWKGKNIVLSVIIATLIVPFETIAIPLLLIVSKLPWINISDCESGNLICIAPNWLDSYHVQIIPFIAGAFAIFLFVQFFKSLPYELVEAARIDGASWFEIYRKIYLPISGPVLATVAILTFLAKWGDYLWPIMVVQSEELRPVQIGVSYFFQLDVAWGEIMAYLSIITIPVLILYLSLQRAFIESIAASGVKG